MSVAKVTTKIQFQDTRSILGSGPKTTPTKGIGGGLFAPSCPSPLSHSITSQSSPLVSSTTSTPLLSKTQKSVFAIKMANELMGTKKDRLSLESARKLAVSQITSSPKMSQRVTESSAQPKVVGVALSATMVQLPESDSPRQSPGGRGVYRFSPGKILSMPPVEQLKSPEPAFVFSPPLTRSAARRKAAASRMVQEPGDTGHEDKGRESTMRMEEVESAGEWDRDEGRGTGSGAALVERRFESAPREPQTSTQVSSARGGQTEEAAIGRHK